MKLKHPLNLHKGLTFIFILGLMLVYDNFTIGAWIYLALHGTYGILWLFKILEGNSRPVLGTG
jgi:hypothetical protein